MVMMKRSRSEPTPAMVVRAVAALLAIVVFAACLPAPAGATPPTPPYRVLEERAEREGAAAVRESYRREVQGILGRLEHKPGESPALQQSLQQTLTIVWLFDFLRSWALVEARDLRLNKTSPGTVTDAALEPLLDATEKGMALWAAEMPKMARLKSKSTPGELERIGMPASIEASVANDRDQALRQLALLAKLANAPKQLERVFQMAPAQIDSARNAKEFLARKHDLDTLLGLSPPALDKQAAAQAAPLSAGEQEAIRQTVHDFWDAFVRRDAAAVERLFLDPTAARALTARMAEANLVGFDLTPARFAFERIASDRVRVRVDNVAGIKLEQGRRVETFGGKTFEIALRDGRALIIKVGR